MQNVASAIADKLDNSTLERSAQRGRARPRAVQAWLFVIAALVFAMVIVGGATRLTGSGLSITEWKPILGAVPPLTEADWQIAFEKYKAIPQYELVNKGMSLGEFKGIYWWEWGHRFLGRIIGLVFLIPFVVFLWLRAIPRGYVVPIACLFLLGGSQGALGWFMVQSGLADRVSVSQYRLAAHLGLAVIIGGYTLWLALRLGSWRPEATTPAVPSCGWKIPDSGSSRFPDDRETDTGSTPRHPGKDTLTSSHPGRTSASSGVRPRAMTAFGGNRLLWPTAALLPAVYLQIIMGAFVAGLKAGHISDTWPLMMGQWIPSGVGGGGAILLSPFEDHLTAHFLHRVLGYVVAGIALWTLWRAYAQRHDTPGVFRAVALACAAIAVQIALGIATIVYAVPLPFALAHQANAMIVFALALWALHSAYAASAWSRSAIMSSASSRPTDRRTTSSPAPASAR
jgi:cytochrome c oxidase assembly protein subunit 15